MQVLRELGIDDIYGAWNEVLWALNVSDGLTPRAFTPYMQWGERASLILQVGRREAPGLKGWGGAICSCACMGGTQRVAASAGGAS